MSNNAALSQKEGQMSGWNVPRNFDSIKEKVEIIYEKNTRILTEVDDENSEDISTATRTFCQDLASQLNDSYSGFRFVCSCFAVKVGNSGFFFDTHFFWSKKNDGFIYKEEKSKNNFYQFLTCIYVVAP